MEFFTLNQVTPAIDDFFFRPLDDPQNADGLVVCNPADAFCIAPAILHSRKSLEEHIRCIQERQLKKAMVIADDISFLRQCPSLEYLWVIPAVMAESFDFSPLYDLPNLRWLSCETTFGPKENHSAAIDYSRLPALNRLAATGRKGHENIAALRQLRTLICEQGQPHGSSLKDVLASPGLETLSICQSPIRSLDGLDQAPRLHSLSLAYCRRLEDISALSSVGGSLRELDIDQCGKIRDFSALADLPNLESLRLQGSNTLPDLQFIRNIPNLKSFVFRMNSADGDLSMCFGIPHVVIQNRKHYSHKDKDFQ